MSSTTGLRFATCILLACMVYGGKSARVKIFLHQEAIEPMHARQATPSVCTEYKQVTDKSTLSFPPGFQHLRKPWESDNVKVIRSETVTDGINNLLELQVPGLNGVTARQVMDTLRTTAPYCLSFVFGGAVRDQFLGRKPNDIDMDLSCTTEEVYSICIQNWGKTNCRKNGVVKIGDKTQTGTTDEIDAAYWMPIFFEPLRLEYTANSLAYDSNPNSTQAIFDLATYGVQDTCKKHIRIPVPRDMRKKWRRNTKIFRFWKLRIKEFSAVDADTQRYIVEEAKNAIQNANAEFQRFYCTYALRGEPDGNTCTIQANCDAARSNAKKFNMYFANDLGNFWMETAKPLVDAIALTCTGEEGGGGGGEGEGNEGGGGGGGGSSSHSGGRSLLLNQETYVMLSLVLCILAGVLFVT